MRLLVILAATAAALPAIAAPSCAVPAGAAESASPAAAETARAAKPLPPKLRALPFIQHELAAGATVIDLGAAHGLGARHGDEFMIFQVTPDGQAAVSGVPSELSPGQLRELAGAGITRLEERHGFEGWFVRSGPRFQVFYITPDKQRVISGVLWDKDGKNITRRDVERIPGAVPTVEIGTGAEGETAIAALPLMKQAAAGTVGSPQAPHLWMLVDPQCIYSVRALQMLQPYISAGRVRVSVVPLAILDHEDQGQSTKSALALLSKPAEQLIAAWAAGDVAGPVAPEAASRLRGNMTIANAIGLHGTPTFIWKKADGGEGRFEGMPASVDALLSSIGG